MIDYDIEDDEEYACALSGRAPRSHELAVDAPEDDDLGEMPVGWMRITIERRGVNPDWVSIQEAKQRLIGGQLDSMDLSELTDEQKAWVRHDIALMVSSSVYPLEKDTPKYVTAEEEVYVYPPEADRQVAAVWEGIARLLGLTIGTPSELGYEEQEEGQDTYEDQDTYEGQDDASPASDDDGETPEEAEAAEEPQAPPPRSRSRKKKEAKAKAQEKKAKAEAQEKEEGTAS